jgi:hypothetical protein
MPANTGNVCGHRTSDGRFRLGVLAGRYAKEQAEYIGAAARAERRRRELARIDGELERLADERQAVVAAEQAAARRLTALDQLVEGLPRTVALAAGLRELDKETGAVQAAEGSLEQARRAARADSERLRQAEGERDAAARAVGVVAVAERLEAVSEALEEFGALGRDAVDTARARLSAHGERDRAAGRLAELERRRGARAEQARSAREQLAEDAARLEAIRASLSGSPEEIHARVEQARQRVQDIGGRFGSLDGTLAGAVIAATDGMATDEAALAAARKGVLDAARRLRDELSGGYDPSLRPEHDLYLLEVSTDDGLLSLFEAGAQLAEAERVQSLRLSSSEEDMFERHLFTSVVQEIQTRMNETATFVAGINHSLAATRTSSGMTVRLHWNRDSDDQALRNAVELLRHDPEQLDERRRERLRRFFTGSIEQARAESPGATYAVILPRVLDYRAWHRFHLTVVDASGTSTRLTPQVFKTLSGGEAAAAVHLPMLAAVDAYLAGADRHAPRLVALDEAFAGIDTHLRGPLLGLLVDFDLDWVIASHELWGNYPEVPSCQIYTMRRRPPTLGVHTQPTRWNGRALVAGAEG